MCLCACVYLCFVSAVHARIFWAQFVAQCPRIHKQGDSDSRQLATPSQGPRLVATCTGLPCAAAVAAVVSAAAAMCFFLIFSLLFHAFLFVFADMYECVAYPQATPPSLSLSLCVLRWRPCKLSSLYCHIALLHVSVACVCACLPPVFHFSLPSCAFFCLPLPTVASSCFLMPPSSSSCRLLPPLATSSCLYFPSCHLLSLLLPVLASSCLFLSLLVCFSLPLVALPLAFCLCRK